MSRETNPTRCNVCNDLVIDGECACNQQRATLIAAAPDLLEALESIARQCSGYERDGLGGTIMSIGDLARAAIAKAEGKER